LESTPALAVIGDTTDRRKAFQMAVHGHPDLVLVGDTLDGTCTAPLVARLRRGPCPISIVAVFAQHLDQSRLWDWARQDLDVAAYLLWSDLNVPLLERCLAVLAGSDLLIASHGVARTYLDTLRHSTHPVEPLDPLSARERALLPLLARWDLDYRQIGALLHIEPGTVKVHVRNISEKFGCGGGRRAVVDVARTRGLLQPAQPFGVVPHSSS
jgi:DNA-binding NarL/FixJ family response regulator